MRLCASSFAGAASCGLWQSKTCANRCAAPGEETSSGKIQDAKRTAWGGRCPAPARCDEAGCRDGDICRHRDRRGGELPGPRPAGAAAGPTHDHPSGRRTSRAWSMCGGKMGFRGSTMTDHSGYLVRYAASHFAGSARGDGCGPPLLVCKDYTGGGGGREQGAAGVPACACERLGQGRHEADGTLGCSR
jgi:hypothetical protein